MPRYRIEVREVIFHTYEIETDLTDPDQIEDFFYSMEDQEDYRIDTDPFEWVVNEIHNMDEEEVKQ